MSRWDVNDPGYLNMLADEEERREEEREYKEWMNRQAFIRRAKKQEQEIALARMVNPRGPRGESMKEEIEAAAGTGSPAELSRYAAYLSAQRGVPLTELNVAPEYARLRGVFNENKYPSAVATGPIPSGRATRKAMQKINWITKSVPVEYTNSPVKITGHAASVYTNPELRYNVGLSARLPLSKAKKNASAAAKKRRTRRTRRSRR